MKKCLIIGKPNVGKTLFMINFAQYIGLKEIEIEFNGWNRKRNKNKYTIEEAKKILSSSNPYKTVCLQSIEMDIPILKSTKKINVVDSSGLIDGVHRNVRVRRSMAQTLGEIRGSDIILHIIDASLFDHKDVVSSIGEVDYQLAQYGLVKEGYIILANKIDLLERKKPIINLQREFPNHYIIPISALTKQGFGEVKSYVSRRI